jgi:hypothetical protein
MKSRSLRTLTWVVAVSVATGGSIPLRVVAQTPPETQTPSVAPAATAARVFKQEELEQLLAPIALYSDPLLAQVLMASTYPLEVVLAARWATQNPKITGTALEDAMQKQPWDPSVKSLTAVPQVLQMMAEKLDWTQKLGDAFLAQQKQVLDTVQVLRNKANVAGNLKSSKEQTVSTEQVDSQTVIKIEPSDPTVMYVPAYNPTVVYGAWPYPAYPPYYYYPPSYYYPPGYYAGGALFAFSVGVFVGAAIWGGCNWGGGGVYINHRNYNNFNRSNIQGDRGNWGHNVDHRKGVAYRDQGTAQRFNRDINRNAQSREQFRGRAEQGRRDIQRGDIGRGAGTRDVGAGNRGGVSAGSRDIGTGSRSSASAGTRDFGGGNSGGFSGISNSAQTRDFSSRGNSSRQSMGGSRGGGRR